MRNDQATRVERWLRRSHSGPGTARARAPMRVGEGDGQAHVSEVEHRGVDGHEDVVLEERIGTRPVHRCLDRGQRPRTRCSATRFDGADTDFERVGHCEHQAEEEDGHPAHHRKRRGTKRVGRLPIAAYYRPCERGEDQAPEDDRALESGPCRGDVERERCSRRVVVGHVRQGEVVGEQCQLHGSHRRNRPREEEARRDDQVGIATSGDRDPTPHQ